MGSVSSLIPGTKSCRGSKHKQRKGLMCKSGGGGVVKHGFSHQHKHNNNNNTKLATAGSGNSDDFFYIKVSHRARGDESQEDAGSRKTPTELSVCTRLEQSADLSLMPQSSSSSVATHNSLSAIVGTNLSYIDRPKTQTPEPKRDMSSGSPCDSGISGSSWTNDVSNSRTAGVHGDGRMSSSSTRSTSVLSDCMSSPASSKTDKIVEVNRTHLFSDQDCACSVETDVCEDTQLYSSEQVSQNALRAQQLLELQVLQLQQDKDRLQEEVDQLTRDRNAAESQLMYKHQHTPLTPTLEETQWEVCQKVGEISLLKQQLKDSQADVTSKLSEIVSLRATLRESRRKLEEMEEKQRQCEETLRLRSTEMEVCENELQRKKNEAELLRTKVGKLEADVKMLTQDLLVAKEEHLELLSLKVQLQEQQHLLKICQSEMESSGELEMLQKEVEKLCNELEDEKQKKEKLLNSFHHEKQTWNKEKEKVIHYQKQLQLNYVQMHRRNQELENKLKKQKSKVDQRTENDRVRTQEDMDIHKTDVHYDEMVATEI